MVSAPLRCARNCVLAVEDRDHGDVEHAAGLARQFLAAPHGAPAIFVEHLLERTVEIVDVLQGIVDIGLAQHRFADFQALVVHLLVHGVSSISLAFPREWRAEITGLRPASHVLVLCGKRGLSRTGTDASVLPL
ncbi:hypothetical protein ABIF99_002440 [Bradyrhizobium japonicum]